MKELEGKINGIGYNPNKTEEWAGRSNEVLKQKNEPYRVVSTGGYLFLQIFTILFFIGIITTAIFFIYLVNEGKLQTIVSNNVTCSEIPECPDCNCPANNCNPTVYANSTLNLDSDLIDLICNQTS